MSNNEKPTNGFDDSQKQYLQGLMMGSDVARAVRGLPILSNSASGQATNITIGPKNAHEKALNENSSKLPLHVSPEVMHVEAQDRFIAAGKQLCNEEKAKREKNPLDMWQEMQQRADRGEFPKGTDVFLQKYHGLFYVSPAQDAYMCRLRFPGGQLSGYQMRGLADLADQFAGGYSDVTTRANLQFREINAANAMHVLNGLLDLGIVIRGSGADNVRNVTASPLSGLDPHELIETLPLARRMHNHILNCRELYGLPRKFNIAFEGGGSIASLNDTNDIGFQAIQVTDQTATDEVPAGVYFLVTLGGITGHKDFARPTGYLVRPEQTIAMADAILRVFIQHGDRTDRKKARLKYLLDDWGFEKFMQQVNELLDFQPLQWELTAEQADAATVTENRLAHIGPHPQKQEGKRYIGLVLPVGRITSAQMRGIASIAERYGSGDIRLTVWQNLLIPNISENDIAAVQNEIEAIGLDWRASNLRSGLVACTGNTGCKFAASNTKGQAMILAEYLESRLELDQPINIHLTGCHHSCAQHYIGDIGLLATKVELPSETDDEDDTELVEGYHVFIGGGWGSRRGIGNSLFESVAFDNLPSLIERLLLVYLHERNANEPFVEFAKRFDPTLIREKIEAMVAV
jgi:ferredoxin-nitrite reductase